MTRSDLALAALATAAVPGMRPARVAAIGTGEENPRHQSALVEDETGRKWLVRAPLGAAAGAELERNDDLIRQLGRHLPFKVPAAAGYADLGAEGRAAVYPYVEGQGLSLRHLPAGPGLSHAVGRALAAIHNIPRELFEEHAVPVFDAGEFRTRKLTELDRAAETGHVPNGLLARWEQALDAESMWEFQAVPTHGSLDGDSFLVVFSEDDAATGRVVGITGWERAQVADPAEDFARLVQQSHPHAVDAVFESYSLARSQRPDGYLLNRAKLASEMRLLQGLVVALGADDQGFVRTRADQLRKLDRLTANDSSLVPRTAAPSAADVIGAPDEVDPQEAGLLERLDEQDASDAAGDSPTDTTAPVPVVLDEEGEEPAVVVEPPADGGYLEPVHPTDEGPDQESADVTAPIPMFHPTQSMGTVDAGPQDAAVQDAEAQDTESQDAEPQTTEPDESEPLAAVAEVPHHDPAHGDPEESPETEAADRDPEPAHSGDSADEAAERDRLHELYGMPTEDPDPADAAEAASVDKDRT